MKIITALNNEKINTELSKIKNIDIIYKDIQYKEGILEILEKNTNIDYIIIKEDLYGQIKIEKLIKKIKDKNKKIKIIIILNKKEITKEKFLLENKISYIFIEELSVEKIVELIFKENKIINIIGNSGCGKTITTLILCEILVKIKNKKILIIEDNVKNRTISNLYKTNKIKDSIQIKNNLYLFNVKNFMIKNKKNKEKLITEINKIKNNFNYIFIDSENLYSYNLYKEIITDNILILEPNIIEINKIKKIIEKINNIKIILNNYNQNSISEKIIKNIFKNKIIILEKLKENINYNLLINKNFNINYLDKDTQNKYINIIKNL